MEKLAIRQLFERFPLTTLLDQGPRGGHRVAGHQRYRIVEVVAGKFERVL